MQEWEQQLAQQRVEESAKAAAFMEEQRAKVSRDSGRAYERFYNNLALFSGGTVALSVTFLGYLKTLSKPVVHVQILRGSWIALLSCLVFSLFYTLYMSHYKFFFLNRLYFEAMKRKYETTATEIPKINIVNFESENEMEEYVGKNRQAASEFEKKIAWHGGREKFYFGAWVWCGRSARIAFMVGLVLLFLFATANI
jgi:hypothetical protein